MVRIHTLYLVIRNVSGKMLVPAESNVQSREFRYGSERPVRRRQCVVGLAQLGRNPWKDINVE